MQHCFSLHGIINELMKFRVGAWDIECWKWWQWYSTTYKGYISWTQFVQVVYGHFEHDTHHLGHLKKLPQIDIVMEYITSFEKLEIRREGQSNLFLKEWFYQQSQGCN